MEKMERMELMGKTEKKALWVNQEKTGRTEKTENSGQKENPEKMGWTVKTQQRKTGKNALGTKSVTQKIMVLLRYAKNTGIYGRHCRINHGDTVHSLHLEFARDQKI